MDRDSVESFWEQYIEKTKCHKVPAKSIRWFVKHIENYIKAHPDVRLSQHSQELLENYLQSLSSNYRCADWQFKQVVKALEILFVEVVRLNWATTFSWDEWIDSATELPHSHSTVARAYHRPAEPSSDTDNTPNLSTSDDRFLVKIRKLFPDEINKLITDIRIKNYSLKTEQTYERWIAR